MPASFRSCIEPLEARIAPAAVASLAYTDRDGDDVLILVSTPGGTSAALKTALSGAVDFKVAGAGFQLEGLFLNSPIFEGANVSITAKRDAQLGGDGFVAVGQVDGGSTRLGNVKIDGDIGRVVTSSPAPLAVKSITAQSIGFYGEETGSSLINQIGGNVGKITVKEDITGATLQIDGNVGSISVGGSLIGADTFQSGIIAVSGNFGSLRIGRNVIAGAGEESGKVNVGGRLNLGFIGGSLLGPLDAANDTTGQLDVSGNVGALRIKGDVVGRAGGFTEDAAQVTLRSAIGTLDLRGSLIGSRDVFSGAGGGTILVAGAAGAVRIGGDIAGANVVRTGHIELSSARSLFIGGNVIGGTGTNSGFVALGSGPFPSITVRGSVIGGPSISGALDGGLNTEIGTLRIGGNLESRGPSFNSGYVRAHSFGRVDIAGDVLASTEAGGSTAQIRALGLDGSIGAIAIGGTVRGNAENTVRFETRNLRSLLVGKNAEYLEVGVQDVSSTVSNLTVRGAWFASRFSFAQDDGADNIYGTPDDPEIPGNATARISRIVFGGQAVGTFGGAESFLVRAGQIGSMTVAGTRIPFAAGAQSFNVGITGDVIVSDLR